MERFSARFLLAFAIPFTLALSACKEVESAEDQASDASEQKLNDIYRDAQNCMQLSPADLATIEALEAELELPSALSSPNANGGPFGTTSIHAHVNELSRIGCSGSEDTLKHLIEYANDNSSVNSGILVFNFAFPVTDMFDFFGRVEPRDHETRNLLEHFAAYPGATYGSTQQSAAKALAAHESHSWNPQSDILQWREMWAPGATACSTSYLQTDGSRLNFISDWPAYESAVLALDEDSSMLEQLMLEPMYCDGLGGYRIQKTALNRLAASGDQDRIAAAVLSALNAHMIRGYGLAQESKTILKLAAMNASDFDGMLENLLALIDAGGGTMHPDEYTRAMAIGIAADLCDDSGQGNGRPLASETACEAAAPLLLDRSVHDLYFDVRLAAGLALARYSN